MDATSASEVPDSKVVFSVRDTTASPIWTAPGCWKQPMVSPRSSRLNPIHFGRVEKGRNVASRRGLVSRDELSTMFKAHIPGKWAARVMKNVQSSHSNTKRGTIHRTALHPTEKQNPARLVPVESGLCTRASDSKADSPRRSTHPSTSLRSRSHSNGSPIVSAPTHLMVNLRR